MKAITHTASRRARRAAGLSTRRRRTRRCDAGRRRRRSSPSGPSRWRRRASRRGSRSRRSALRPGRRGRSSSSFRARMSPQPTVDELFIAAPADAWSKAGFEVSEDTCEVGTVRLRLRGGPGRGIVAWSVRDAPSLDLDGLDTRVSKAPPVAAGPHPNGTLSIDHLVVITPDLDRTSAVLQGAGFDLRRLREGETPGGSRRQAFFRMGELILEVVAAPEGTRIAADPTGPARLWGISF